MKEHSGCKPKPHALITGAASGIGLAVTKRILAEGWSVSGIDIAAAQITDHPEYRHITADLTKANGLQSVGQALHETTFTAFVHAAGIVRDDATLLAAGETGETLWTLHVGAAGYLADVIVPQMPDGQGRIVMLSSRGSQGRAGRGFYAATKAGGEAWARSLALALLPRGITVNAVAPGPTDTPQTHDPARARAAVANVPIGRPNTAEEVAASVCFLLSPDAGTITGQTLFQCGGLSLSRPESTPLNTEIDHHAKI